MGEGCEEKFDFEFLKYIWDYRKRTRDPIEKILSQYSTKKILRFKNRRQLNIYLKTL